MGIGTSDGAYYDNEGHFLSSMHDVRYDDNYFNGTFDDVYASSQKQIPGATKSQNIEDRRMEKPYEGPERMDAEGKSLEGTYTPTDEEFYSTPAPNLLGVALGSDKLDWLELGKNIRQLSPDEFKEFNRTVKPMKASGEEELQRIRTELKDPAELDKAIDLGMSFAGGGMTKSAKGAIERIGPAAIKWGDEVFTGLNHGEAYEKLLNKHSSKLDVEAIFEQIKDGFMTSTGRFVNREEALKIADQAKQLVEKPVGQDRLISEDVKGNLEIFTKRFK